MELVGSFILGAVFGGLVTWLWINARNRWKQGRGMVGEPKKTKAKMKEEAKKSQAKAEQGRRQIWGACLFYIAIAILVFLVFVVLRSIMI